MDNFWQKVNKTGSCWIWTGRLTEKGYGSFSWAGAKYRAHRLAWTLTYGEIPAGMSVLHRCDVRNCCNPAHLFLGSHAENMADMVAKLRQRHKLSPDQVVEIRDAWKARTGTQRAIGARYGVCQQAISQIVLGQQWGHLARVPSPPARQEPPIQPPQQKAILYGQLPLFVRG